jgi:hypothetical protein
MTEDFKISQTMTKKQLIEEHQRLLEAFRDKVHESAESRRSAEAARREAETLASTREASVEGVVASVGQLRSQTSRTFTELVDQMTAQADHLASLNRAVATQERRVAELHDVEAAALSLDVLVRAYDERRQATEEEFAAKIAELEDSHAVRRSELEREIAAERARWEAERVTTEQELAATAEGRARERQREEEEYAYQRDRERKIAADRFADEKAAREAELERTKLETERALAEREAAVAVREAEIEQLRREVDGFPKQLDGERRRAADEATKSARAQAEREHELVIVQRQWEAKMLEERIAHLERDLVARDAKLTEIKADLDSALRQAHQLAAKALERRTSAGPISPGQTEHD